MKTVAIGDIHGNYKKLMELYSIMLEKGFNPKEDKMVVLGDMVDGGEDVKGVIDQCMQWQDEFPHWVFLRGNHEDMMLDVVVGQMKKYKSFDLWWSQGGRATTHSYIKAMGNKLSDFEQNIVNPVDVIPVEHLEWLTNLPLYHEEEKYFFVHAGVPHAIKLSNFTKHINEGDEEYIEQALWIRDEFINSNHPWEKKIIYGHTPERQPNIQKNKIGIDTMTRAGGVITALFLPSEEYFQTNPTEGQWW